MAERTDWPNHDWYGRPNGPSEFSWGPGLVPPGKETEPPSEGGIYRGCARRSNSPPAETSASEQGKSDASQATRRVATPATGFGSRGAFL
jgi:hypothetical protein